MVSYGVMDSGVKSGDSVKGGELESSVFCVYLTIFYLDAKLGVMVA